MNIHEYFCLGDGFTRVDLLKAYRRLAFEKHPDTGGSEDEFDELQKRYEEAMNFANVGNVDIDRTTSDGTKLSTLGKGLPLTISAKTCDVCGGNGYVEYRDIRKTRSEHCKPCDGSGLLFYPCKKCDGSGKYGYGECFLCGGSGRFYPKSKRPPVIFQRLNYIPGTKVLGINCRVCGGYGTHDVASEYTYTYGVCKNCEGKGEVRIYNPVIPRGFLANTLR